MKQTFFSWKVEAEVTIPRYGVGTSYNWGTKRGVAKFELMGTIDKKVRQEALKHLLAQNIPRHRIGKIKVIKIEGSEKIIDVLEEKNEEKNE